MRDAASAIAVSAALTVDFIAFVASVRWPPAYFSIDALARALVLPFVAIALTLYYFDVRVRHEGFDIDIEPQPGLGVRERRSTHRRAISPARSARWSPISRAPR